MAARSISLLILCGCLCPAQPAGAGQRYLYWLTCGGVLRKFDTHAGKELRAYDLPKITEKLKIFPQPEHGAVDGCLAYEPAYDPASALMYVVLPEQYHVKADGTKDYKVVAFAVPALRVVKKMPSERNMDGEPAIESVANGRTKVVSRSEDRGLQTKLDVSTLTPDGRQLQNRILENSGGAYLLDLFDGQFAVADPKAKRFTRLSSLPATSYERLHLAPGGGYVLIEQTEKNALALYDAKTGRRVGEVAAAIKGRLFFATSPNGKAIYQERTLGGAVLRFFDLEMRFGSEAVSRVTTRNGGMDGKRYFFAER